MPDKALSAFERWWAETMDKRMPGCKYLALKAWRAGHALGATDMQDQARIALAEASSDDADAADRATGWRADRFLGSATGLTRAALIVHGLPLTPAPKEEGEATDEQTGQR